MEYLDGAPLRGPMAAEEAVRLSRQIASALEAAHAKGILHRDLKPDNVVVSGGSAKLLDFGLAKLAIDAEKPDVTKTIEGTVLGTVAYMSPEQAQGQALDERSDIFSFGALLYELLSGRPAFHGRSTVETLSAVLRDEPRPIGGSDVHGVPEVFGRIVMRCLRKAPAERFQHRSPA